MVFEIKLMPKHTLGFYLQLASVGVGEFAKNIATDLSTLYFKDNDEYVRAIEKLESALRGIRIQVEDSNVCKIAESCEGLQPKLYTAGEHDSKILEEAGLNIVPKRCGMEVSWCSAALSYIEGVKEKRGPIGGKASIVMLARTFAFGKLRGPMGELVREIKVQIDSLGLMLIGGLFSLVASMKMKDGRFELYMLPDGSPESLKVSNLVYKAFFYRTKKLGASFEEVLRDVVGLERGLSVDLATLNSLLIHLSSVLSEMPALAGLPKREGFERFLLAKIDSSSKRPQLTWMSPLTISSTLTALKGREELLENLWNLVRVVKELRKGKTKEQRDLGDDLASAISTCFNNMTLFMWTRSGDHLLECSRSISAVIDGAFKLGFEPRMAIAGQRVLKSIKELAERRP
jgi:hypothetical protein